MEKFFIEKNNFLKKDIIGYYNCIYSGFKTKENPDFINLLKNTFNNENCLALIKARREVINRLQKDIPEIIKRENLKNCICVSVPRAKIESKYSHAQLLFKNAISIASQKLKLIDGTNFITRIIDTKTTHLKSEKIENNGDLPYPEITKKTCKINKENIEGNDIILIDDIYTKGVNIDEDCIQALLDNGARKVIFYSIGFTRRNK